MGLDMTLYAERYFWRRNSEDDDLASAFAQISGIDNIAMPLKIIRLEAGYWRKANQVHNWFVHNIQKGEDDCGEYYVSRENLLELRKVCREVLDDNSKAATLFPRADGFFFGNQNYDQWYFTQLVDTIKIVDNALSLPECWDFSYRSSW